MNLSLKMTDTTEWQTFCDNLKMRFKKLLANEYWTDCKFVVGCESNRTIIKGHKLLLATASPVFEAMFYGSMPEMNEIIISDVEPEIFEALLQYIYSDEIEIKILSNALDLFYAAKKYIIPHLAKECLKYIMDNLKPENVCQIYEVATLFDENDLINNCTKMISTRTMEVLSKINFEEIRLETMINIFKMENLDINSELDLFNVVLSYVNARKENQIDKKILSINNEETIIQLKKNALPEIQNKTSSTPSIRDALKNIRFLSLTPEQFAEGPAKSGFLTKEESFSFFMKICSPESDFDIPEGFTTVNNSRKQKVPRNLYYTSYMAPSNNLHMLNASQRINLALKKQKHFT